MDERTPGSGWALRIDHTVLALAAGAGVLGLSMGIRQVFGLFVGPLSVERGWPVATFAFALALQNLIWGLVQPFVGAAADRWGPVRVIWAGTGLYAAGLTLTALSPSPIAAVFGAGILVGVGISTSSFAVILGAVGRMVTPERRSFALGVATAGGSFGQMAMIPVAQDLLAGQGVVGALEGLGLLALAMAPLALLIGRPSSDQPGSGAIGAMPTLGMRATLIEAFKHRGFRLLTLGFFVCGFHIAFVAIHLPGYLATCHMPPALAGHALIAIGFFNMVGSWVAGILGDSWRPKYLLSGLYLLRALGIALFLAMPISEFSVMLFAAFIGSLWLATVPLTSGVIVGIFGARYLGTLFGIVFLSHQVGAFLGAWLGGTLFDLTGSYDAMWYLSIALGLAAAVVHLPISDRALQPATP
ncbi:MAG: MFS transporter [Azospirillum sp.]|nr:MFS transporter [Azospirillum sp.]